MLNEKYNACPICGSHRPDNSNKCIDCGYREKAITKIKDVDND